MEQAELGGPLGLVDPLEPDGQRLRVNGGPDLRGVPGLGDRLLGAEEGPLLPNRLFRAILTRAMLHAHSRTGGTPPTRRGLT
jgi:hypothetical protein